MTASRIVVVAACLAAPAGSAVGQEGKSVYKQAINSVVYIINPMKEGIATGSGSLIDYDKKLVITNFHVVDESKFVHVQFPSHDADGKVVAAKSVYKKNFTDGKAIKGEVLARDKVRDLALVKLASVPKEAKAVKFAAEAPDIGEKVHSIGNPGASDALWVYSPGEVRQVYVKKWLAGGAGDVLSLQARIIETTSPTNPGDSGGPLFNDKAEQVAVTQGGSVAAKSVSFFIEASEVQAFLKANKIEVTGGGGGIGGTTTTPKDPPKSDPKAEPTVPPKVDPKTPPAVPAASDEDENKAKAMLKRAEFAADSSRSTAIKVLRDLMAKYPATESAKKAKKMLKDLE